MWASSSVITGVSSLSGLKREKWRNPGKVWDHLDLLWSSQTLSRGSLLSNNICELERYLGCRACFLTLKYNKETWSAQSWTWCLELISYVFSPVSAPVKDVQGNVSCWTSMPCLSQNSTVETSQILSPESKPGRTMEEISIWSF